MSNSSVSLEQLRANGDDTAAARAIYDEYGCVILQNVCQSGEIGAVKAAIEAHADCHLAAFDERDQPASLSEKILLLEKMDHKYVAHIYDFVNSHPALYAIPNQRKLGAMLDCLVNGSRSNQMIVNGFQLRLDLPGNESELLDWHRDIDYFPGFSPFGAVLWLPLDDVSEDVGGISLYPYPERTNVVRTGEHMKHWPNRSKPHKVYEIDDKSDLQHLDFEPVRVLCNAGDAVVFSLNNLHRSEFNRSAAVRLCVQVRCHPFQEMLKKSIDRVALEGQRS